jgi:spore germination protein
MRRQERRWRWAVWTLAILCVLAVWFGTVRAGQVGQLSIEAENKYMAAFHRLKWAAEGIEERLAKLQVATDRQLQLLYLADLRVLSAQAVEQMTTLPLLTVSLPEVTNFLQHLQAGTEQYHARLAGGEPLDLAANQRLADLHRKAARLEWELADLGQVLSTNLIRWSVAVAETDPGVQKAPPSPIVRVLQEIDLAMRDTNPLPTIEGEKLQPKTSLGAPISPDRARDIARAFADQPLAAEPTLVKSGAPGAIPIYYFSLRKATGDSLSLGITEAGGHLIFAMNGRPVGERREDSGRLEQEARFMLRRWGYGETRLISRIKNAGALVMDFAPVQDGVVLLPDRLQVTLAMDNSELLQLDTKAYWVNHRPREIGAPHVTREEAAQRGGARLRREGETLPVLIADRLGRERLAWEVTGRKGDQLMKVYIDATTGEEVDVVRFAGDPFPPLQEGPS